MLREYPVRRHPGEPARRWFADEYFDLVVGIGADGGFASFQLCYNKGGTERALTWSSGRLAHAKGCSGEEGPARSRTPIPTGEGLPASEELTRRFEEESGAIDPAVRAFVLAGLRGSADRTGPR